MPNLFKILIKTQCSIEILKVQKLNNELLCTNFVKEIGLRTIDIIMLIKWKNNLKTNRIITMIFVQHKSHIAK